MFVGEAAVFLVDHIRLKEEGGKWLFHGLVDSSSLSHVSSLMPMTCCLDDVSPSDSSNTVSCLSLESRE